MCDKSGFYSQHNLDADSITFSMFTPEDIKKLCITKIITPMSFDSMGYPLPGGLYDKTLGPLTEKSDPCGTCLKNYVECPGHFGYIELPLPVVNPLFHKIIQSILKITCLTCFRMQLPDCMKRLISTHMHFLDCGMITNAKQVESLLSDFMDCDNKEFTEASVKQMMKLEKLSKSIGTTAKVLNKTTESLRNKFLQSLLKQVGKQRKRCLHCKVKLEKIHSFRTKLLSSVKRNTEGDGGADKEATAATAVSGVKILTAEESRRYLRQVWLNDEQLLSEIVPMLKQVRMEHPTDVLYLDVLAVPPVNVRPVRTLDRQLTEHARSHTYKQVLEKCVLLRAVALVMRGGDELKDEQMRVYEAYAAGETPAEKLHRLWEELQSCCDCLADRELGDSRTADGHAGPQAGQGLKQLIEKKAGVIRMHMMGKRVNYAARSVITPDPNLGIEEIGVPEQFAMRLTYPACVTAWNVEQLRRAVMNGPRRHPGATHVRLDGRMQRIDPDDKTQQEAILKRLLTPPDEARPNSGPNVVHRHLRNGDVLLLNRQPTLHRPSIMAHVARVLPGERTLRLHYANCQAYNADFDGDEMNAHFPQGEVARIEAFTLAHVSRQYLVPKDGSPLAGLIQDHVVAGARLTERGRLFARADYHELAYRALADVGGRCLSLRLLSPAIVRPRAFWTGKQLVSTVVLNCLPATARFNLSADGKIRAGAWPGGDDRDPELVESRVLFRGGELVRGVLDKAHLGATRYGLAHCVYELYGGESATRLLGALARLLTAYLQFDGFTLGVRDVVITREADEARARLLGMADDLGREAATQALNANLSEHQLSERLDRAHATDRAQFDARLDRRYKRVLDRLTNEVNGVCVPRGLLVPFPRNQLQLMVQSGAKGSAVNAMQISCLLGQIELEGSRPPVMLSGKTLPCYAARDVAPCAGGFVAGRFATGLRPPDFFFHCMAGREGLIDTAVKTSRSGYLQRCLVKHLEGLRVAYDLTVRDSDGSLVQLLYGEDGMDVTKVQFLHDGQLPFLLDNAAAIVDRRTVDRLTTAGDRDELEKHARRLDKWRRGDGDVKKKRRATPFALFSCATRDKLVSAGSDQTTDSRSGRTALAMATVELWRAAGPDIQRKFAERCTPPPEPLAALFQPDHYLGSLSDRLIGLTERAAATAKTTDCASEAAEALRLKAMRSLAAPGEPVGLLAAQSIGEPSTQMTLNTFHFAGRGDMNVTLGIPRLREILMMASENIKTPSMEVPFLPYVTDLEARAELLCRSLARVTVADVLERIHVVSRLQTRPTRQQVYTLNFRFLPRDLYENQYVVTPRAVLEHMARHFFEHMFASIRRVTKISTGAVLVNEQAKKKKKKMKKSATAGLDDDDGESSSSENEDAAEDAKLNLKMHDKQDDQEPSDSEVEKSDSEVEAEAEASKVAVEKDETEAMVVDSYSYAQRYTYDKQEHLWCELTFCLPVTCSNVDLTALLKDAAAKSVVHEVENIKRAITYVGEGSGLWLRTDGINVAELFKYDQLLDLKRLYSNDIHRVAETYGVEAARRVIVKEVKDVFKVYGIAVDTRHLLLIADYMTYNGAFEPLSRSGMESSASPLQQMSFESSLNFLRTATIRGKDDALRSPSGSLMLGKPCTSGTGAFALRHQITHIQ